MLKTLVICAPLFGLALPALAQDVSRELGTSRPSATAVKKEKKKKMVEDVKKTEMQDGVKKEEHMEHQEHTESHEHGDAHPE